MNILHVTPYYAPAWAFGGVVQAVTGLAEAQAEAGHQVAVLTTDAFDRSGRLPMGEQMLNGVRLVRRRNLSHWLRSRMNLSMPLGFGEAAVSLLLQGPVDVVHGHELRTAENLLVARPARRARVPLIVSPHGTAPADIGRGLVKKGWDRVLGSSFIRSVALVLALSPAESEQARSLWLRLGTPLRSEQVAVVPNGVRLLPSAPEAGARFRQEWNLGEGPVIAFVGRLTERKRVDLLVSAFARVAQQIRGVRLLIVGPDEGWLGRLKAQSRSLGVGPLVTFTGMLTGEMKQAALEASSLFVLPGAGEGFPIAVLEAMACRLPVIVTEAVSGIAPSEGAVVVPPREGSLAEAMVPLLEDGAQRTWMGGRGRQLVAAGYTWTKIAARVVDVYRQVAQRMESRMSRSPQC